MAIAKLVKKAALASPRLPRRRSKKAQRRKLEALELDDMWTLVGRLQRMAVERALRHIVAWLLCCRGAATARSLWAALPHRYQHYYRYHTDQWQAYAKVLPALHHRPHPKGSGKTTVVEAINCSLRQRCGRFSPQTLLLQQVAGHALRQN